MNSNPILASRNFPRGHAGCRVPLVMLVYGGLHYIKGNAAPYFTLTYEQHRKGFRDQNTHGGSDHEYILKYFPRFADLAALHLSDIDGVPMHAESNGWYWLAGALGGMGERYHGGNSTPVKNTEQCLRIFATHCRISFLEAQGLSEQIYADRLPREKWRVEMEMMRPRWKQEADACIANHALRVFGDAWPTTA